jgi:S-adenosylmethionine decarboxylase
MIDESHVSAHSYADLGLVAMDVFTCGNTDPHAVLEHVRSEIPLGQVSIRHLHRFVCADPGHTRSEPIAAASVPS